MAQTDTSSCQLLARRGFYNPFVHGSRAQDGARSRGAAAAAPVSTDSYYLRVSSFKFIAPRCLDEHAPPERRTGTHIGTISRAPRVYGADGHADVLEFAGPAYWPRRVTVWGGTRNPGSERSLRFERFHVYDIVETSVRWDGRVGAGPASTAAVGARDGDAVVTLLGLADTGHRVAVHVFGVRQYFYMVAAAVNAACGITQAADVPRALVASVQTASITQGLLGPPGEAGRAVSGRRGGGGGGGAFWRVTEECFEVSTVDAASVYYFGTAPQPFYKIAIANGRLARYVCDNFCPEVTKYESSVDVTTRFLLDHPGFTSFGWYRLTSGPSGERVAVRPADRHATSSDVEIDCVAGNLVPVPPEEAVSWPDYKLLCFDIECKAGAGDERAFPVATNPEDVVIQISCVAYSLSTRALEHTLLFSLGSCDLPERYLSECEANGLPAPIVLEFDSEFELLLAFMTFFKQYSAEYVSGYNIVNFDWPYICDRLTVIYDLRLDGYGKLNRGGAFRVFDAGLNRFQKQSKVKISGVVVLDMYGIARDKLKLASYKLNAVAEAALGERKVDLPYADIPAYFAAGAAKRGVIGEYCIKDSVLVGKLFFKYLPHLELSAVAKLANITLPRAIFDGQQIRVFTCLLKLARERGFLLPSCSPGSRFAGPGAAGFALESATGGAGDASADDGEEGDDNGGNGDGDGGGHSGPAATSNRTVGYQGAKVLDPVSGFHVDPVVVLDFASLYPSIIQAHNLCFTTLALDPAAVAHLEAGRDYAAFDVGPQKVFFVRPHVRPSLLSILLRDWLAMRKAIRARIPSSTPEEAVLLDKQQAAIKVVCNSVYGFTGVAQGLLPCLQIAATVTTIGRDMLMQTRDYIHARWATAERLVADFDDAAAALLASPPAPSYSIHVIYGDTDSVFIKITGMTYDGVCAIGDQMAQRVSQALFQAPIKLECEKVFSKLLLITKKKYIGVVNGGKVLMKGVELVRKHNCRFINMYVQRLVDVLLHDDVVSAAAAEISRVSREEWLGRQLPAGFARFGAVLREAYEHICAPGLDVDDFVMTAELSRAPETYVNKRLAHLTVFFKLVLRNGARPSVKDRIPYVIIDPSAAPPEDVAAVNRLRGTPAPRPTAKPLVSDMAEDPGHVRAHKIPLNTDYYFSHLLGTLGTTFKALFGNDAKTTDLLLKRFIPETRGVDVGLQARLARAGFTALTPATGGEESHQMLCTACDILTAAPHRN